MKLTQPNPTSINLTEPWNSIYYGIMFSVMDFLKCCTFIRHFKVVEIVKFFAKQA